MLTCVYKQLYGAACHHCIAGHACIDVYIPYKYIHCVKYLHKQREEISVLTFKLLNALFYSVSLFGIN